MSNVSSLLFWKRSIKIRLLCFFFSCLPNLHAWWGMARLHQQGSISGEKTWLIVRTSQDLWNISSASGTTSVAHKQFPCTPALLSLVSCAHLKQSGRLLYDSQKQIVNVVLQVSNLRFDLFQLSLTLLQLRPLLVWSHLLLLHVHLLLQQQGDQLHVGQVLVVGHSFQHLRLWQKRKQQMSWKDLKVPYCWERMFYFSPWDHKQTRHIYDENIFKDLFCHISAFKQKSNYLFTLHLILNHQTFYETLWNKEKYFLN